MVKILAEPQMVFNDYKKTGLYIPIGTTCTFKCMSDLSKKGIELRKEWNCHNQHLAKCDAYKISCEDIISKYNNNPFVECFILSGLEPIDNIGDILKLIKEIRLKTDDEIVIFTGYNESEILDKVEVIKKFKNITMKFGRFDPTEDKKYDDVGMVELVSNNQYFKKIS